MTSLAHWLDTLLAEDLAAGTLTTRDPYFEATTNTGLDQLVEIITADLGLNRKVSTSQINEAPSAADAMNQIIL